MRISKIFISYSSKDKEWVSNWLLPRLENAGVEVCIDFKDFKIGRAKIINMEEAVKTCDNILLILTPDWVKSKWANFESLIAQDDDPMGLNSRLLPLLLKQCEIPKRLDILTNSDFTDPNNRETELNRLLGQLNVKVPEGKPGPESPIFFSKPKKISISKMPTTGAFLFGRENELKTLDDAWENEHIHVVTLVAWGGVGKTALVNHWLNKMETHNYKGAERVYAWSFYSQGAEEGKQASADEFMQEILKWFDDDDPTIGSAVEKGRRLARLVKKQRTLLILDGMEPLQYPPGEVHGFDGKLKDPGMRAFLKELSAGHMGLCVITSREKVTDLADRTEFSVKVLELEHLSHEAGAELLKSLGVKGSDRDILAAAEEYDGHALALTLLGRYMNSAYKGDIRKRDKIPRLVKERIHGGHARRVMEAYERWLGKSAERNILYMMGLFDRPSEGGAIEALKAEPPIPGVTDQLVQLSEEDWNNALFNLRNARLLAKENQQKPDTLDCHPLIREHFGEKLQKENKEGWKESHKRLYNYFKELPKKEFPDALQEMEPLFAAVAHGSRAGLYNEAAIEVFWNRLSRRDEAFIVHKLGAFGSYLSVLSHFFEKPWNQPTDGLPDRSKALVLGWSAFGLRAVGRLREAIQPMKAGLELLEEQKNWKQSAIAGNNLSELMLTLGEVKEAVEYARHSVAHADQSGDAFQQMARRTTLADALHQWGERKEAEKWFREAEAMQKDRASRLPILYSIFGFRYCDLLMGKRRYNEVMERADKALKDAMDYGDLLSIALGHLTLGRAWTKKTEKEDGHDFGRAMEYLNRAVQGLREGQRNDYLPRTLFVRTACFRLQKQFSRAWDDLMEAKDIAELGEMKLHMVDYHLESARLCSAEGKADEAKFHFETARKMIEETGYHRRDAEIMNVEY